MQPDNNMNRNFKKYIISLFFQIDFKILTGVKTFSVKIRNSGDVMICAQVSNHEKNGQQISEKRGLEFFVLVISTQ